MSGWLLGFVGAIYLGVAVNEASKDNWPMFVVYISYALGNVGFIWALEFSGR